MVLEHLFPDDWMNRSVLYPFLLGAGYSIIGISIANLLFPADPALVAVAFTAMLLLPEMNKLFSLEEGVEKKERRFSIAHLWKDNKEFIKIYLAIAFGIFIIYTLSSAFLPQFQVNQLFREQLEMRGIHGGAVFMQGIFWDILINNWWVLLACFFIALLTGDGAVFLITWNASVWGTIFGVTARNAALFQGTDVIFILALVLAIVLPHAILEILSYIMASISGGVISKDVILEGLDTKRFWEVFSYNIWLLVIAIIVLILGSLLETYVLGNVDTYATLISQSYMVG